MVLLAMAREIKLLAFSELADLPSSLCEDLLTSVNDPDRICYRPGVTFASDVAFSSAFCVPSSVSEVLGFLLAILGFCPRTFVGCRSFFGVESRVRMEMLAMLGSASTPLSKMSANKDAASSSAARQSGKDASEEVHVEKSVDKLNVREFCERFCIPNGVSVQLVDGEAVSTEKSADNAIFFTKEQFNAGLRFPLPSLFKEFLHFTQIPPAYIHPNMVRYRWGATF
ncbi:hypothetical protein AAG906_020702 [Vitis piasezkii]